MVVRGTIGGEERIPGWFRAVDAGGLVGKVFFFQDIRVRLAIHLYGWNTTLIHELSGNQIFNFSAQGK